MWNFDISQTKAGQELIIMGEKAGKKTGEKTGKKTGKKKKAIEIAKNLLSMDNIPIERIAEATGLSLEEVRKLHIS